MHFCNLCASRQGAVYYSPVRENLTGEPSPCQKTAAGRKNPACCLYVQSLIPFPLLRDAVIYSSSEPSGSASSGSVSSGFTLIVGMPSSVLPGSAESSSFSSPSGHSSGSSADRSFQALSISSLTDFAAAAAVSATVPAAFFTFSPISRFLPSSPSR